MHWPKLNNVCVYQRNILLRPKCQVWSCYFKRKKTLEQLSPQSYELLWTLHNRFIIIPYSSTLEANRWRQFYCTDRVERLKVLSCRLGGLFFCSVWTQIFFVVNGEKRIFVVDICFLKSIFSLSRVWSQGRSWIQLELKVRTKVCINKTLPINAKGVSWGRWPFEFQVEPFTNQKKHT